MGDKMFLLIFIMLIFGITLVSASTSFTPTTDTNCDGNVCTKTLYSGVRNVYEDSKWKRVEDAKSLKDSGIECVINSDGEHIAKCLDWNMTSIKIEASLDSAGILSKDIPIKIYSKNNTGGLELKKQSDVGFSLFNNKKDLTINANYGEIIHFGESSTTIILQDADTENLEDTYKSHGAPDTNGAEDLRVGLTGGHQYTSFFKFNLLGLGIISEQVIASELYFRVYNSEASPDTNLYYASNQSWIEDSLDLSSFIDNPSVVLIDTKNVASDGLTNLNSTYGVRADLTAGNSNSSYFLNMSSWVAEEQYYIRSKEYATSNLRPYLSITYYFLIPPNITINFPLNKTYNANSLLFNLTILGLETPDTCWYSLNSGEINYTMTNITSEYTHTNTSIGVENYRANFYCNDSFNNINDTEFIDFRINWGGALNATYRFNEGIGTTCYDNTNDDNGINYGSTYDDDGVDITLTQDTDYTQSGKTFTIINTNYAWNRILTSYEYETDTKPQEGIEGITESFIDFIPWIGIILLVIAASIVLVLVIINFKKGRI